MFMRPRLPLLLLTALIAATAVCQAQATPNQIRPGTRNIVFVCEHGAALSVVSAAYFNKIARDQHLNWHAVARGVTPQENLSVAAAAGLKKDGVATEVAKPQAVTQDDLDHADYVVTFLPLPNSLIVKSPIEGWEDVQWNSSEYEKVRDAILKHLDKLLPTITARKP